MGMLTTSYFLLHRYQCPECRIEKKKTHTLQLYIHWDIIHACASLRCHKISICSLSRSLMFYANSLYSCLHGDVDFCPGLGCGGKKNKTTLFMSKRSLWHGNNADLIQKVVFVSYFFGGKTSEMVVSAVV